MNIKELAVAYQEYLIAALSALVLFLKVVGVIDAEAANALLSILLGLLGVSLGRTHAPKRIQSMQAEKKEG